MSLAIGTGIGLQFPLGGAGGLSGRRAQIDGVSLSAFTVDRASSRTVLGFPEDGVIADGKSLLSVSDDIPAFTGGRLLAGNIWSIVDADGADLDPALNVADSATNSCQDSRDIAGSSWANQGTPTKAQDQIGIDNVSNTAWTIGDDSNTTIEFVRQTIPVSNNSNQHIGRIYILKDTDETRNVSVEFLLQGGTSLSEQVDINTKTGAFVERASEGTVVINEVSLGGRQWWEVVTSITNNSTGNTSLRYLFIPAVGTILGTIDATTMGTCVIDQCDIILDSTNIGPPIVTSGATASRAADEASISTPGVLTPQQGSVTVPFTPDAAGQAGKSVFTLSYTSAADHVTVIADAGTFTLRKRISSVNTDAVHTYTHTKDTPGTLVFAWDGIDIGLSVDGASFDKIASATDMPLGVTSQYGQLEGANFFVADFPVAGSKFSSILPVGW